MFPINVVEKETNISKYLLRMWERRYSFPRPERDSKGERVYTKDDVEKLQLIKRLMEEGYRPSKIIDQGLDELRILAKSFSDSKAPSKSEIVILVTGQNLEDEIRDALKDQNITRVLTVTNHEDIRNLSF